FAAGNTMSGRPGSLAWSRYRSPLTHKALRRRISGVVLRPLIRDMQRLRCSTVSTSVLAAAPLTFRVFFIFRDDGHRRPEGERLCLDGEAVRRHPGRKLERIPNCLAQRADILSNNKLAIA